VVRALQNDRARGRAARHRIQVGKVNVDEAQNLAVQFNISAIPTLLVFKNGDVIEQIVGAKSLKDLKASLDRALA